MSQEVIQYEYSFEIEDILKQFISLIDKSIIMRYEKVENERRLVQTITPMYKFSTKNRVLLMTLNSAKNFALPCVAIELTGIQADKERIAAKNNTINRFQFGLREGYKRPTPITISLKVSIITKYVTDLYQIYGKLATQFQPELFYSWAVPTNQGIYGIEELRNKIEWDMNISLDNREKLTENDEDRYVGTMNFSVQGWLFPTQRECQGPIILDIGTSVLVSNELENRIDGLINKANPLVNEWLNDGKEVYGNPREFATSHVRILKAFLTANKHNFIIRENHFTSNIKSGTKITLDGYNLSKAKVLVLPQSNYKTSDYTVYKFDEKSKLFPKIGEKDGKNPIIKGFEQKIISQSNNFLTFELNLHDCIGKFDIIVYDEVDYDTFNNSNHFYLNGIK